MEEEIKRHLNNVYKNLWIDVSYKEPRTYIIKFMIQFDEYGVSEGKTIEYIWDGYLEIYRNLVLIEKTIDDYILNEFRK